HFPSFVYVRDTPDAQFLTGLVEKYPRLDFWIPPVSKRNSTVLVPPHIVQEFKVAVNKHGMRTFVLSDDVQSIVDAGSKRTPEKVVLEKMRASGQVVDHYNYHNYSTIRDYINKLESKYPRSVGVSTLTFFTQEGRYVTFAKLSNPYSSNKKPVIIVEAGIHGREWIAPAATLWFMEKMLQDYQSREPTAKLMLDKYDWFVVPVTNPDGYQYSHTTASDPMWTKNRRYIRRACRGVDLNRNFNTKIGTSDANLRDQCETEFYHGYEPFSEPESLNIRDLFDSLQPRVVAYVSVRAYGQSLLVPWSYTSDVSRPANHDKLDRVASLMARALSQRHGNEYSYGIADQRLDHAVSGNVIDWVQAKKPDVYAVMLKLRPSISAMNGFLLPSSEIIPTGEELYDSLAVLAREIPS
ncbi:unnamed protein product, partial [Candidula unifasciata]